MNQQRKCIYCLVDQESSAFNREHVVPGAFGRFEQNLVLTCVCKECNAYFGDTLDRVLGRDSGEALLRLAHGLRSAKSVAEHRAQRVNVSVPEAAGEWQGMRVEIRMDGGEAVIGPVPQVALARKWGGGRVYVTEAELSDTEKPLPEDADSRVVGLIFPPNAVEVRDRLVALLAARGITLPATMKTENLPAPPGDPDAVPVDVRSLIDPMIQRGVAKIAFNYTAWVAGADFACLPDFDSVRAFIRRGVRQSYRMVVAAREPILADDLPALRQTTGHLITLGWAPTRRHLVGQVSLFNTITYRVSLARYFSGIWREVRSGHHFNIAKRRVSRMLATSLEVPGLRSRRS